MTSNSVHIGIRRNDTFTVAPHGNDLGTPSQEEDCDWHLSGLLNRPAIVSVLASVRTAPKVDQASLRSQRSRVTVTSHKSLPLRTPNCHR